MTHDEQRVWLIRYLMNEDLQYKRYRIPEKEQEQKDLLRALMNVRPPEDISGEFLRIQDEYLTEENRRAGIVQISVCSPVQLDPRIFLWQGDMTRLCADAIVNPANSALLGCFRPLHSCADNIIHSKAGIQLRLECSRIMEAQGHDEPTGQAKITGAYNLPCGHVIHTVGPIVEDALTKEHEQLLASCYRSCLNLAARNHLNSIVFCCISTGVFMFPNQRAAEIAVQTVKAWLDETGSEMRIIFDVYKDLDLEIYRELLDP